MGGGCCQSGTHPRALLWWQGKDSAVGAADGATRRSLEMRPQGFLPLACPQLRKPKLSTACACAAVATDAPKAGPAVLLTTAPAQLCSFMGHSPERHPLHRGKHR
jgi:hypothetical protein